MNELAADGWVGGRGGGRTEEVLTATKSYNNTLFKTAMTKCCGLSEVSVGSCGTRGTRGIASLAFFLYRA